MGEEENLPQGKIILGIDPGTQVMGYGVIRSRGNKMETLTLGILELHKFEQHNERLKWIFSRVKQLIVTWEPDAMAVEAPFFGKNVQSMLKLGRAQGVAMAAALDAGIEVTEYSPRRIKQAITGNGNAAKEQVAGFLVSMLQLDEIPKKLDATDGLAVAVCHHLQQKVAVKGTSYNSWKDFINKNPGRVDG